MPVLSPLHTSFASNVSDAERQNIIDALRRNDGRRKATAQELNISERTLYRKIREYGLE
jgi:DNA-binding NtrC family response regulator